MSVFPLEIVEKVNSPELVAFLQQFGHDKYADADDINKIVAALEELHSMASNVAQNNTIIVNNGFTKVGLVFTGLANSIWNLNGLEFTNPTNQVRNIALCATGLVRMDRVVLDTNNDFVIIPGQEVEANPVPESKPANTLDYTLIPVSDSEVGDPTPVFVGDIYQEKKFDLSQTFNGSGSDVVIELNKLGRRVIVLNGTMTSIKGCSMDTPLVNEYPHEGKIFVFINQTNHDITLRHFDASTDFFFLFKNEVDLVFPAGETLLFMQRSGTMDEHLKSWVNIDSVNGLPEALDLKADITYVDSLVVGLWNDRGPHNASSNTFPSSGGSGTSGAIKKGDIWTISVAGTLGSEVVEIGDTVRALINTPGTTPSNWAILQNNIGYIPENSVNKTNTIAGNEASTTLFGTVKAWIDYLKQGFIGLLPTKSTLVDADGIVIGDSADSSKTKIISFLNFKTLFKTINGSSIFGSGNLVVGGNDIVFTKSFSTASIVYNDGNWKTFGYPTSFFLANFDNGTSYGSGASPLGTPSIVIPSLNYIVGKKLNKFTWNTEYCDYAHAYISIVKYDLISGALLNGREILNQEMKILNPNVSNTQNAEPYSKNKLEFTTSDAVDTPGGAQCSVYFLFLKITGSGGGGLGASYCYFNFN